MAAATASAAPRLVVTAATRGHPRCGRIPMTHATSRPHNATRAYPIAHRRTRPGPPTTYARSALDETIRAGIKAPTVQLDAPASSTVDFVAVGPTNVARQPLADATTTAVPASPCPTLSQNGSADTHAKNAPASASSRRNGSAGASEERGAGPACGGGVAASGVTRDAASQG